MHDQCLAYSCFLVRLGFSCGLLQITTVYPWSLRFISAPHYCHLAMLPSVVKGVGLFVLFSHAGFSI